MAPESLGDGVFWSFLVNSECDIILLLHTRIFTIRNLLLSRG